MAICQNCGSEKNEFKREKVGTSSVKTYQSGSKSNSGRVGNKKNGIWFKYQNFSWLWHVPIYSRV